MGSRPPSAPDRARRSTAIALVLGLAACAATQGDDRPAAVEHRTAPESSGDPVASPFPSRIAAASASLPSVSSEPSPAPIESDAPHQAVLIVLQMVEQPASQPGKRVIAIELMGDVGRSAVIRTLDVHARTVPIAGSRCSRDLVPTALRPSHADVVEPALADETRQVIVRSLGLVDADASGGASVTFRSGPIPSLNGAFVGWLSFEIPVRAAGGYCAFDVHGSVTVVAGETTSVALPGIRVDSRDGLDAS